ncbi:[Pyruvate dehydrogenase [lipoamide]] kinase [Paecilomyces variotii No. 5]|uniref:Protein-serine/threonine kinase n=1 Tax=Byssochlamys spectabilis (strain No. 5 / NBRC 109023) TaxID=1356009 RepID=V5FC97_BYSSN|nr:[Pyruvate dehydrogenase [lipoamide]] kinase [Paecilomyces variotii No. 5]
MWKASERLMDTIRHYASFPATGVSLRQMVQFGDRPSTGTLFRASQFLSEELPIRLAHRVQELGELPDGLNEMPSIKKVRNWYAQSFEEIINLQRPSLTQEVRERLLKGMRNNGGGSKILSEATQNPSIKEGQYRSSPILANGHDNGNGKGKATASRRYFVPSDDRGDWPPELDDYNQRFAKLLQQIKRRHDGVVTTVAQGILEYKRQRQRLQIDSNIQSFLDRFYMSRIGIRMLIGQHIALTEQKAVKHPNYVGIICTKTNVRELALEAIENARFVCEDHYGLFEAPKVQLVCKPDLNFMYVPGHLSHMLFETLKNSLRAVVETHGADKEEFPVTKVIVAEGREDITIKISDEGGGIPRSSIPLVWTYMYTTVDQTPNLDPDFDKSDFKAPMAGFGYGLPISRLYARYFGGDLKLISMEGYGTDVYLHLNRLSSIPLYEEPASSLPPPPQSPSRGLTPMNTQALRSKVRNREVSERKQVGDAESLINSDISSGSRVHSDEDEI